MTPRASGKHPKDDPKKNRGTMGRDGARAEQGEFINRDSAALVERKVEMESLDGLVRETGAGRGGLITLEGPAGIGKSRLIEVVTELGRDCGLRVLRAYGSELETEFQFGAVRQLFEPFLGRLDLDERDRMLGGAASLAARVFDYGPPEKPPPGADPSFPVLNGLYWLVSNLAADRPLILTVDDVHWCDQPSLRFFDFLARRIEDLPVRLVLAFRPEELNGGRALSELLGDSLAHRIRPSPLTLAGAAELVRTQLGAGAVAEFCKACHEATGGNPFLLRELIDELAQEGVEPSAAQADHVRDRGPRAVARAVLLRLRRLPAEAESFVQAAAVLGDETGMYLAASLAGLKEQEAACAAAALVSANILVSGTTLRFLHPTVRAAVLSDLSPAERARRHARAARELRSAGAPAEQVAAHLLAVPGEGFAWATETLREAAAQAVTRGTPGGAVGYLRRALSEPPPAEIRANVLRELGTAELQVGDPATVEHLREALELTEDSQARAETARTLTTALVMLGRVQEGLEVLERVVPLIRVHNAKIARRLDAELTAQAWFLLMHHPEVEPSLRDSWYARLERLSNGVPSSAEDRLAEATLAFARCRESGSAEGAAAQVERALAGGLRVSEQGPEPSVVYGLMHTLLVTDRLDLAQATLDQALSDASAEGSAVGEFTAAVWLSHVAHCRGDMAVSERGARHGLEQLFVFGWPAPIPYVMSYLVDSLREQGRLRDSEAAILDAGIPDQIPVGMLTDDLLAARGRLRIALGRHREGVADLLEFGRRAEALGATSPAASRYRSDASAGLAALGELKEARRLAEEDVEVARVWGTPRAVGTALRARGRLERGARAAELLAEAVAVLEDAPSSLERAHALVDLGGSLRRMGRRSDARDPLRRGLEMANKCAAWALEERAREELAALGVRPRRVHLTGVKALTPSEHRVARLAASGLSNREAAATLFVTPKTVEIHLTHAYQKLGIRSRTQLRTALAEPTFEAFRESKGPGA